MANYTDPIERLGQVDPTLPPNNETADKTPAMIRQLKAFLVTFLKKSHKDNGELLGLSITATQIGAGAVRGADSNTETEPNEVALGTISTPDLRDAAASTAKIADKAVTDVKLANDAAVDANRAVGTNHIKDASITKPKMANDSVGTAAIEPKAVTSAELANDLTDDSLRAVGPDHIKTAAVTTAKIPDLNITFPKLAASANGTVLGGTGTGTAALTVAGALTAQQVGTDLIFSIGGFAQGGAARFASLSLEKALGSNLIAGDFAAPFVVNSQHIKFNTIADPGGLIQLDPNGSFVIHKVGFYIFFAELDVDAAALDRAVLAQVKADLTAFTSFVGLSNGHTVIGMINTTLPDTRFALLFKFTAALPATVGTAKGVFTTESYAKFVLLAL